MKNRIIAAFVAVIFAGGGLAFASPAFATDDPVSICHSGNGVNFEYIAPDNSGAENGHVQHEADVFGLTEEECLAKNPVEEVDTDYVTVAWLAGAAPPNHFDVPQDYLFSQDTEDPALGTLDDEIAAYVAGLECETTVDIQVDVYYDNATTDSLIAGGYLNGPSDPDEDLIPGGEGTAWKFVHAETGPCPIVVIPNDPGVKDLCGVGDDHYGYPAAVVGIVYSRSDLDIVATLQSGYTFGTLSAGWVDNGDGTATFPFTATTWTDEPCGEQPEPYTTYTEWVAGDYECLDTEVEESRTGVTTTFAWANDAWVGTEGEPFVETNTRALTESEIAALDCPPTLALTGGSEAAPWVFGGIGLLGVGALAIVGASLLRRREDAAE